MSTLSILAALAAATHMTAAAQMAAGAQAEAQTTSAPQTVQFPETSQYQECIALLRTDTPAGRRHAQQWVSTGGGADARHCLAIADLESGFPGLAAARLEDIAERKDAGDDFVRARVLAQAAEAWLKADEISNAQRTITEALLLVPDSGELQLTAAKVFASREQWQEVIDAVDAAEEAGIVSAETFVLRGRGYYTMGSYETAAQDVVAALSIAPTNIDALVLRGDLQQTGMVIDVFYDGPDKTD